MIKKSKVLLFITMVLALSCVPKHFCCADRQYGDMPSDPKAPGVPSVMSTANTSEGLVELYFTPAKGGADGYEVEYCTDEAFGSRIHTKTITAGIGVFIQKLSKDKTYFFRMRGFRSNYKGDRVYGEYSNVMSTTVLLGLPDIDPEPGCAEIMSVTLSSGGNINFAVSVPERVRSTDDDYYLVKVHPHSNTVLSALTSVPKDSEFSFDYPVSSGGSDLIMSKFAVAVKDEEEFILISDPHYIDNPEAIAPNQNAYPTPLSKKGRQGIYDTGAGDKHYFHNFYLDSIIASSGSYDTAYTYNGKTYYFYRPTRVIDYNPDIMAANKDGGTVTMQIMLRWNGASNHLITPTGRTPGYQYYALNVEEDAAREQLEAAFMYLAEYWSQPNRHVDNWILGNEVNTYLNSIGWYWAGRISRSEYIENYAETFRLLYYAVKSHYANGRVFICTDHTWNDRDNDWGSMGFMTTFNSTIKAKNENIVWNLANHTYTAVLTNSDFWNDGAVRIYSVAHSTSASFVSPYNMEVMTNYVRNNFPGTRIILSEVGFSSTGGPNPTLNGGRQAGPDVQAVATAWLFYKGQFTDNIDAVIFHTGDEGEPGKNFSLYGKPAWNVYLYMDTPSYATYTNPYLPVCGASSWESIVPGFNSGTLQRMPSR